MAARAKAYKLRGIIDIRPLLVIRAFKGCDIYQHLMNLRLPTQCGIHVVVLMAQLRKVSFGDVLRNHALGVKERAVESDGIAHHFGKAVTVAIVERKHDPL